MCLLPADERGLRRALELASDAAAFASPNPTVGCVLMRSETVLGEGAHFYDNFDHAEIAALKQAHAAGHDVHGATACVTLEPCAHHGRTGPETLAGQPGGRRRHFSPEAIYAGTDALHAARPAQPERRREKVLNYQLRPLIQFAKLKI